MQPAAEQLVVRQHERYHCRLAATLSVSPDSAVAEQVKLARTVGDGSGNVKAFVTDCSRGGLGIESPVFFPRGCRIKVQIGSPGAPEMTIRVQRVSMISRAPSYYLGVSFVSKGIDHDKHVAAVLETARAASVEAAPVTPDGKGGRT